LDSGRALARPTTTPGAEYCIIPETAATDAAMEEQAHVSATENRPHDAGGVGSSHQSSAL